MFTILLIQKSYQFCTTVVRALLQGKAEFLFCDSLFIGEKENMGGGKGCLMVRSLSKSAHFLSTSPEITDLIFWIKLVLE